MTEYMTDKQRLEKTMSLFQQTFALHTNLGKHLDELELCESHVFNYFIEKAKDEVKEATEYLWNELGKLTGYNIGTFTEVVEKLNNPVTIG